MGHAGSVHQGVGHRFVHADNAAQHAAAHIGNAGDLKQALDGAVLAVFAVEHRNRHIHADGLPAAVRLLFQQAVDAAVGADHAGAAGGILLPAAVRHGGGVAVVAQPTAILGDAHTDDLILFTAGGNAECPDPGSRRDAADFMLAGYAAEKQRHAQRSGLVGHGGESPFGR